MRPGRTRRPMETGAAGDKALSLWRVEGFGWEGVRGGLCYRRGNGFGSR